MLRSLTLQRKGTHTLNRIDGRDHVCAVSSELHKFNLFFVVISCFDPKATVLTLASYNMHIRKQEVPEVNVHAFSLPLKNKSGRLVSLHRHEQSSANLDMGAELKIMYASWSREEVEDFFVHIMWLACRVRENTSQEKTMTTR
jgi:hypothetical protein